MVLFRDSQRSRSQKPVGSHVLRPRPFNHRPPQEYSLTRHRRRPYLHPIMSSDIPPLTAEGTASSKTALESSGRSHAWKIAPDLFTSFRYAWAGITYAFNTQRNFRVHTGVGAIALVLCWGLRVSNVEVAIISLTIGAVLVMEILNTALESLVDLTVGQTYHELAKIAKDCAAGAVLMAAMIAVLIAGLIFLPPLWAILSTFFL